MKSASVIAQPWTHMTPLERGERGTVRTLRLMAGFVRRDAASPQLRQIAHQIIGHVPGHDFEAEIEALFRFCRDRIVYRKDPVEVERVQDALRTIQFGSGDCDDKVVLLVSLLAVCGHHARFVVSGPKPGKWTHVYCEARTREGRWIALDPTPEQARSGWSQPMPAKGVFEIWPHVSANIRLMTPTTPSAGHRRAATSRPVPARSRSIDSSADLALQQYLQACAISGICEDCALEMAGFGLGADKYEWKFNSGSGKCELKKKSCGFFCKVGNVFKSVGKVALAIAPLALAPFTAGGSLALTGAAGTALAVGTTAISAANQIISKKYGAGLPADAQIAEPSGQCKQLLQQEAEEEARKQQEAINAQQQAQVQAAVDAALAKQAEANKQTSNGLMSNPLVIGALALGGLMLLRKQ